jgi:hypothetical protein
MERARSSISLLTLLVATSLAAIALARLGSVPWLEVRWCCLASWAETTAATDALAALARWAALVAALWVLGSSLLYVLAVATGKAPMIRVVGRATLPSVRRWVERAITSGALITTLALPAVAGDGHLVDPRYVPVPAGDPPATTTTTQSPVVTAPSVAPPAPVVPHSMGPAATPEETRWTVRSGDNFWRLAEATMVEALGRTPTPAEVDPYWRRLVEANRPLIRSGDPDLIFPGEIVVLPPVTPEES